MSSGSESDSDAPEAIGLTQSAQAARGAARELEAFRAEQKHRVKEKNRARDAQLKERAAEKASRTKGKGKSKEAEEAAGEDGEDSERVRLEARMQRAMDEAEGESENDLGEGEGAEDVDMEEEGTGESEESEESEDEEMGEEASTGSDEEDMEDEHGLPDPKSKYLPDHLFASALSSAGVSAKRASKTQAADEVSRPAKKRKRATKKSKDILIGSRTIRALPSVDKAVEGTTTPPRRVARFLTRALALKGQQKTAKGWERRPANIGILRRSSGAPAVGFVRSR